MFSIPFRIDQATPSLRALMKKYAQVPMDLPDAGACEERPSLPCSFDGSPELPLLGLLGGCPGPGTEFTMAVTFSQGCATHLYANGVPDYATSCYVPILESSRFECIGQSPCLGMSASTLAQMAP